MEDIVEKIYANITSFIDELDEVKTKFAIRMQVRKCLNYMNRKDFPEELIEPLAEAMILEYMENDTREVKAVTAGDTREEYTTGTAVSDKIALSMREQLNRYRRIGTIGTDKQMQDR